MASLKSLIDPSRTEKKTSGFTVTMVHYSKLIPSESNNYSTDNIEELANMILLSGGIKQNLLARKKTPEEYELIAGHRRRLAVKYLVEKLGLEEFAMVPVHVEKDGDLISEINLILTNCAARERSDWEKMMEVTRLTELLKAMQTGSEEEQERFRRLFGKEPGIGGRELRKVVAESLGLSETKVANLNHIENKLSPELKERFRDGEIGVSVANAAAGLPPEKQKEIAEKPEVKLADVKKTVSDSDTGKSEPDVPKEKQKPVDPTEPVAISQQPENTGLCLHRSEFPCTLPESTKNHPGDGTDCTHSCCWDCVKHGNCKLECYASAQRPELPKEQQNPVDRCQKAAEQEEKQYPMSDYDFREKQCDALARKMIQFWKPWFEQDFQNRVLNVVESEKQIKEKNNRSSNKTWYFTGLDGETMHANMFDDYIQFWGRECLGNCDWFYLCAAIQRMWQEMAMEEARNRSGKPIEQISEEQQEPDPEVIDAEFTEIKPTEKYTPQYFLEKEKKLLKEMTEVFKDEKPENIPQEMYAHKKIVVAALAAMVCDLENEELKKQLKEEKPEQPELPKLKNNDQRAAFIDAYATWPIWIETKETGERYYRYELPDAAMVVKVYYHKCFDYSIEAERWEDRYHDDWGDPEYYLIQDRNHFKDCRCNRGALIDYLKEIQNNK